MSEKVLTVAARGLLVAIFLGSAVGKIVQRSETIEKMSEAGVPVPSVLIWGAIAFLLAGGISVLLGAYTKIGSTLLMVFLALATFYFHDFWNDAADSPEWLLNFIGFQKNLGLFGALLFLFVNGPGPGSLDLRERVIVPGQVEPLAPEHA